MTATYKGFGFMGTMKVPGPKSYFDYAQLANDFQETKDILETLGCTKVYMPMKDFPQFSYVDSRGMKHTHMFHDYRISLAVALRTELRLHSDL